MIRILRIAYRTLIERDLPDFESEIRLRQVVDLGKQAPFHAIGNVGNGLIMALVFWGRLPHAAIVGWIGLFILFSAVGLSSWWRKRSWPMPKRASRRAIRRSTIAGLFAGVMWMIAVLYAFPADDRILQFLLLFLVSGLSAGATASMAMQPVACTLFIIPPMFSILALLSTHLALPMTPIILSMGLLYLITLMAALISGFGSFVAIVQGRFDSNSLETRLLQSELAASTAANRAKSMFLATISHELRTPLNAVIGFSEIIRDQAFGPGAMAQYRDYAADIHEAGNHLLNIVNDVLEISRIEAGRLDLQEGAVDLTSVAASALKMVEGAAVTAGVSLSSEIADDLPFLWADELRVRQIMVNLLTNGVKFSTNPGNAVVGAALQPDGRLAMWVSDNGIGMSEPEIEMARKPFHQVATSLARGHGGAGLGLSLVQGFASLHNAEMEIESAPSVGTTVTILFPPERILRPGESRMP